MKTTPPISTITLLVTLAVTLLPPAAKGAQCRHELPPDRPRIGLALGGGGARGYAHIGVLQVLEELHIPYDYIAGTSMGSIVGAMAATGMDSEELIAVIESADWEDLFSDQTAREEQPARRKSDDGLGLYGPKLGVGKDSKLLPTGVVAGQKILFMFESVTSQRVQPKHFDHLPIPFRAVSTDIVSGEMVVLEDGALSTAMRASMAVPAVFDPVRVDDRLLVDGGLVRNLPVDVVRDMGAEVVIAVDVGTPLAGADDLNDVLDIVEQMTSLLVAKNTDVQEQTLTGRDVLITPQLGDEVTSTGFEKFGEAIPIGQAAASALRDRLSAYSLSESQYRAWKESVRRCVTGTPTVQFVRINNRSRFSNEVLRDLIHIEPGGLLDVETLDRDLRSIYAMGFIRVAKYRVIEEEGRQGVVIDVVQDARGTDFIETGLTLVGSGRGTKVNLQAGYLKTDIDERGSEFRAVVQVGDDFGLLTDLYKYLDDGRRWFLNPYVGTARWDLLSFNEEGRAENQAELTEASLGIQFGREFGRHSVLGAGLRRSVGTVEATIGSLVGDRGHFNAGEWNLGFRFDRLDDLFLPTRGALLDLDYVHSSTRLGADENFEQLQSHFLISRTWDVHNLLLTGRYNTTLDGTAPPYAVFTGGGFLNMSGFEPSELFGQHFGMVGAGYRYQLLGKGGFLPGYVGMTLEYGNAAEERSDVFDDGLLNGSIYFAYGTPLGPLYLGYGFSEDRSGVLFLQLGSIIAGQQVGRRR